MALGGNGWRSARRAFASWSGTMVGYDEPGKPLGKTIEYYDRESCVTYIFPVPEAYQGKADVVLVTEHPDFTLREDGRYKRIVLSGEVGIVEGFPADSEKWYHCDPRYGIPTGIAAGAGDREARFLWRVAKKVGLAVCGFNYRDIDEKTKRYIYLNDWPSDLYGVAVEAREKVR